MGYATRGQASHITTASLARLFRLVTGMQKKQCPMNQYGNCYWCEAPILFQRHYVGDMRGTHYPDCPWNEVIDYASMREFLENYDVPGAKAIERAAGIDRPEAGDGDGHAARPVRPADESAEKGPSDA